MEYILIQLFYGFSYGSLLFLIASGFSLIFGLMKITNIVHVAYFALGLYLGNYFYTLTGSFLGASLIVMVLVGAFGLFVFRSMLYKMQTFPLGQVLLGLGLLFLVDDGLLWIFGGAPMKTPTPEWLSGNFAFLNSSVSAYRLFMLDELAEDCAADGRYEFFFTAPPIAITNATGSPLNPQAIK